MSRRLRCCPTLHVSPVSRRKPIAVALSFVVARSANRRGWWRFDREPTIHPRTATSVPRGVMGRPEDPRSRICRNSSIAVAYTSYSRGGPGFWHSRKVSRIRETRCLHVPEHKDAALLATEGLRLLGFDSIGHDAARSSHLDLYSPDLRHWAIQAMLGGPPGALVGCQQNWNVTRQLKRARAGYDLYGVRTHA